MINRINKTGAKSVKLPRPCTYCKGLGHLAFGCTKKPRKPLRAKKPMRKIGKVGRKLSLSNKAFLDAIPADELYCYYCLFEGVEQLLARQEAQAEHFLSRARHPDMRYDKRNLVVSCARHNQEKASLDGPEYLRLLDQKRRV